MLHYKGDFEILAVTFYLNINVKEQNTTLLVSVRIRKGHINSIGSTISNPQPSIIAYQKNTLLYKKDISSTLGMERKSFKNCRDFILCERNIKVFDNPTAFPEKINSYTLDCFCLS